ncbi:MAG TPA: 2-dehydropantoate 2-reductase [Thermohalobaculum sp.]|nr:2-dehydropantoate 2-reductase [Thermohalobaculum sp.]
MKVCIYGAGAIGGYLAHGLAGVDGCEVAVIARGAHLEALRENGLTLETKEGSGTRSVTAAENPAEIGTVDAVFNCLKAHQAWASAEDLAPLLGPDTAVVTCQNGVPWWYFHGVGGEHEGKRLDAVDRGDRQWRAIGPERAIGCSVYPAAEVAQPGVIRHTYGDKFALGEPDGSASPRVKRLSELLEAGGFRAPVLDDIRSELWLKLWGNLCFNPLSALTRGTLDVVASHPTTRATAKAMMLEAQAVAEALGASFRVDVERRIDGAAKVGAHRTSMLQDLDAGKAMEIDALVTAVAEMGRIAGQPTPTIDVVLGLVQQLGINLGLYPTYPEETSADAAA